MSARRDEGAERLPDLRIHYQGEHSRRLARLVVALWVVIVLWPALVTPRPVEQFAWTAVVIAGIFLVFEWLLARRMGVTVRPEGLTLHTALGWRRLPWSRIDHFAWRRWKGKTQCLYAITPEGKRIQIPTVQRGTADGWHGKFFGSQRLLARDGRRVDALGTLNSAMAAGRVDRFNRGRRAGSFAR